MHTYIAFFKGINVGGHNILPMAKLRSMLTEMGLSAVRTYIQSGNLVFQSEDGAAETLAEKIQSSIQDNYGFAPQTILLNREELEAAVAANPFPEVVTEPKLLHLFFLKSVAHSPDLEALERVKAATEEFRLIGKVFYLYVPDGLGRSTIAARIEKALGVPVTARNWRTVNKVLTMAGEGG